MTPRTLSDREEARRWFLATLVRRTRGDMDGFKELLDDVAFDRESWMTILGMAFDVVYADAIIIADLSNRCEMWEPPHFENQTALGILEGAALEAAAN